MITEEQKEARKLGIGGSDMPIILGIYKYKTPYQLYCEKKGLIKIDQEETQLQYWGNRLERLIRIEFRKRNKVRVETKNKTMVHPFYDFLRGNLDGFIPQWNAVFEAKCSHAFMAQLWGETGSDIIPMEYLVQIAFYCSITNADCAYLAVLIGGNDYREFKYTRDLELEETIINAACNFWHSVQNDLPPPATAMIDLKLMFPKHSPEKIKIINDNELKYLIELKSIKSKMKELDEQADKAKFNLVSIIQDSECLQDSEGNTLATYKSNKKGTRTFLLKGNCDE